MDVGPHDLLRVAAATRLVDAVGRPQRVPAWAARSLSRRPWVVVRRDVRGNGMVPVGVRGDARRLRHGAWIDRRCVIERVTPEELAEATPAVGPGRWPAILGAVASIMAEHGLPWGPTGSVGFELATGSPSTGEASDLDVLVRAPSPVAGDWKRLVSRLGDVGRAHGCRVDCMVETPAGGVHLDDLAGPGPVLARGDRGPLLVADPWYAVRREARGGREG